MPPPRDRKDQTHYESLNQKHEKRWKKKAEAERPPPPPPRRAETRFGESIHPSSAYCSTNTERGAAGGERSFILTKKTSSFYPEVFVSARLFSLTWRKHVSKFNLHLFILCTSVAIQKILFTFKSDRLATMKPFTIKVGPPTAFKHKINN